MAKRPKDPNAPSRKDRNERIAAAVREEDRKALIEKLIFVVLPIILVLTAGVIFFVKRSGGDDVAEPGKGDKTYEALQDIGVHPMISGCSKPTNEQVPDDIPKLQPNQTVKYPSAPPAFGPHREQPAVINDIGFHTLADRPPLESLVANLDAGWTIVYFDGRRLGPRQVELIKEAAEVLRKDPRYSQFAAVEWDAKDGDLPDQGPIVLTRWQKSPAELGHRSFCTEASGEAFRQWMAAYGAARIPGVDDVLG